MVEHNNVIPNSHFRKHWQNYVKTWFNQPARKTKRRNVQAIGITNKLAPTIGVSVDQRRKNRSLESLQANVHRLKIYKSKLVIFPRRAPKFKSGVSAPEELATATQVQGLYMPIARSGGLFD